MRRRSAPIIIGMATLSSRVRYGKLVVIEGNENLLGKLMELNSLVYAKESNGENN
jgi:hypothetical protein